MFLILHCETLRLGHINLLFELPIQESRLDIKMMNLPTTTSCEGKYDTNCIKPCNWHKYFIKMNPLLLDISFCNQASLVFDHLAI
jgi:hypothetical protein